LTLTLAWASGLREDALRQELADMRKRWQDQVARHETLAADMHESTTPLTRQIKALQEEARVRSLAWASAGG
jgi:TATA element modulatory factor